MKQLSFSCADISFTISLLNGSFNESHFDYFQVEPGPGAPEIKIAAAIKPIINLSCNTEIDKPPDCTINNHTLTIVHPCYQGTYNLRQNEGTASVSSLFSLMAFIRLIVSVIIIDRGGLAIHSAGILKNNRAYIFSGPSGHGKSTIVKLTDNPRLFSDEVTLVRKDESGIFKVHHSPFRSEFHTESLDSTGKIAGMFFLQQDSSVYLESLPKTQALIKMLPNVFFPIIARNQFEPKIFQLCLDFLGQVKPVVMHFKKDNSFWRCIDEEFSHLETESGYDHQNH